MMNDDNLFTFFALLIIFGLIAAIYNLIWW